MKDLTIEKKQIWRVAGFTLFLCGIAQPVFASADSGHGGVANTFLWMAILLMAAKIASSMVEKVGQPSVLGELAIGVILGNIGLLGWHLFEPIKASNIIVFLSELGVVILLFQVGLESNIRKMLKVGPRALLVAVIGVIVPFGLGWLVVGPWLLPGLSGNTYLFLGATLTATSVGITARVFQDLNRVQTNEAQIVLGAAVIDDVLGLIILAVVTAIVTLGSVSVASIGWIFSKATIFLIGSIVVGLITAPMIGRFFSRIQAGVGMKCTMAICFALVFAYVADLAGLAAIVGAFAAGLVLDPVHFRYFKDPSVIRDLKREFLSDPADLRSRIISVIEPHTKRHVEDLIETIGHVFVPIFFVYTGMTVRLETLFDTTTLVTALGITLVAVVGKFVAGFGAGQVNKTIIGFGMVPRGEVGLIFASIGHRIGVVSDQVFSIIVIMVILTTLMTPPILAYLIRRQDSIVRN